MDSLASPNIWAHEPVVMGLVGFGLVSKVWYKGLCYWRQHFIDYSIIITTDLHILSMGP